MRICLLYLSDFFEGNLSLCFLFFACKERFDSALLLEQAVATICDCMMDNSRLNTFGMIMSLIDKICWKYTFNNYFDRKNNFVSFTSFSKKIVMEMYSAQLNICRTYRTRIILYILDEVCFIHHAE